MMQLKGLLNKQAVKDFLKEVKNFADVRDQLYIELIALSLEDDFHIKKPSKTRAAQVLKMKRTTLVELIHRLGFTFPKNHKELYELLRDKDNTLYGEGHLD